MAIIFETGWEDYADGTFPEGEPTDPPPWPQSPYQDSLINAGWTPGTLANSWPATYVESANAHSGSKALRMGSEAEDGQEFQQGGITAISRAIGDGTNRTIAIEAWFKRLDVNNTIGVPPTATVFKAGPTIKLYGSVFLDAFFVHNPHLSNTLIVGCFNTTLASVTDVLFDDVYQKIRAEIVFSTVNLTVSPVDLNLDGRVRVYVDDVRVVDLSGIRLGCSTDGWDSGLNGYTDVYFTINGWMDDLIIQDGFTTPPDNPISNTPPCCHTDCCGGGGGSDSPGTQSPGQTGPILPPVGSGWTPACAGGGTVPTAADVTDAESWVM